MPNIKSSIRSVKSDALRKAANSAAKSRVRNAARKVEASVAAGAKEEAAAKLVTATSLLDKVARKGIIHKNAAARKKSRLAKKVNAMA